MFHVKQGKKVVVIGGGHAGCEAALATSRMGIETWLITMDPSKIGEMSCNPSIGGVGKGQLVRELDALGGEMGKNADYTGIQFKQLNTRKGSAVQSSRCQSDKKLYAQRMQKTVLGQSNLKVLALEVSGLVVQGGRVVGINVKSAAGPEFIESDAVIITSGTFMKAVMHCGSEQTQGGRFGEAPSLGLSDQLRALGLNLLRLKTGTPPRLLQESIDFSRFELQPGDPKPKRFSFSRTEISLPQVPCYLSYSNPKMHALIAANLGRAPLFSGQIRGVGPRYCPSIEDKVVKFPEKDRHALFFEPESLSSNWIYPNGISTSLPSDVQEAFVRAIPGCEQVVFARYGYAVEYDCIDPKQLRPTLECKEIEGLYFGGQVNGTSGYEEAAAQGLMSGINAALKIKEEPAMVLGRGEAYIGVMIDDLTRNGVSEPYRMFTSRAEYRLSLREDNADLRLRPMGRRVGLVSDVDFAAYEERRAAIARERARLRTEYIKPRPELDKALKERGLGTVGYGTSLSQFLRRSEVTLRDLAELFHYQAGEDLDPASIETLEIEEKYSGYIEIQRAEIERLERMRGERIPEDLEYDLVEGLSTEVREKLCKNRPLTLANAADIPGVTPSALTAILFYLKQKGSRVESSGKNLS